MKPWIKIDLIFYKHKHPEDSHSTFANEDFFIVHEALNQGVSGPTGANGFTCSGHLTHLVTPTVINQARIWWRFCRSLLLVGNWRWRL